MSYIYYTPEGGTEQSIDTGSNLTHYNLTGFERNRVYTNIAVQVFNSVGRSARSNVLALYNHTPPGESWHMHAYAYTNTFKACVYYDSERLYISLFDFSVLMKSLFWLNISGHLTEGQ